MKSIQLLGFGNGLVDLQYELDELEFSQIGLRKGEMVLVGIEQQNEMLKRMANKPMNRCSGGSAANTIIAFSQLGGKAAYKTVIGNDEFGRFYESEFRELGIILKTTVSDKLPTGTCIVLITPDSERTFNTCLAATAEFSEGNVDEDLIARSEWIYFEGYKFSEESSTRAIFKMLDLAKKHNTKIAVTFSDTFVTEFFKGPLSQVAENSDLIFCNETEALSYWDVGTVNEAFVFFERNNLNAVITLGASGSMIITGSERIFIEPHRVKAVDTTGAGDVFAGAFLYGLINTGSLLVAGELASAAGARVASQMGARIKSGLSDLKEVIYSRYLIKS